MSHCAFQEGWLQHCICETSKERGKSFSIYNFSFPLCCLWMLSALEDVMFLRTGSTLNFYELHPSRNMLVRGFGFPCRGQSMKYNRTGQYWPLLQTLRHTYMHFALKQLPEPVGKPMTKPVLSCNPMDRVLRPWQSMDSILRAWSPSH